MYCIFLDEHVLAVKLLLIDRCIVVFSSISMFVLAVKLLLINTCIVFYVGAFIK